MAGITLAPIEEINVILANMAGNALKVAQDAAAGADATSALTKVWNELRLRYRFSPKVAVSLRKKLEIRPNLKEGPTFGT